MSLINVPGRLFFSASQFTRYNLILDGTFIFFLKIGALLSQDPQRIEFWGFSAHISAVFLLKIPYFSGETARISMSVYAYAVLFR